MKVLFTRLEILMKCNSISERHVALLSAAQPNEL